ncbi:hypothetical protein AAP_00904 [Ascosphaera apis ARSEF 7405]|uniref:Uncharacterized protein n=1 Tax=Ascosphaera apis ARSEF 7405 TaxID=392613 RepID=A0A168D1H3_9EURO|nr:hypothetical protein AAP_00904 [Ascosphaera apis ARSEF 7405]
MSIMTSSNLGLALNPGILAGNSPPSLQDDRAIQSIETYLNSGPSRTTESINDTGPLQNNGVARPSSSSIPLTHHAASTEQPQSCANGTGPATASENQGLEPPAAKRRKIADSSSVVSGLNSRELSVDSLFGDAANDWSSSCEASGTTQQIGERNDHPSVANHHQSSNPAAAIESTSTTPIQAASTSTAYMQFQKLSAEAVSQSYVSPYTVADEEVPANIKEAWESYTKPELIVHIEKYRAMLRDVTRKHDKNQRERRLWDTRDMSTEKTIPQILTENKRLRKNAIEDRKTIAGQNKTIDTLRLVVRQLEEQAVVLQQENSFLAQQMAALSQKGQVDKRQPERSSTEIQEGNIGGTNSSIPGPPSVNDKNQEVTTNETSNSNSSDQSQTQSSEIIDLTGDDDIQKTKDSATSEPASQQCPTSTENPPVDDSQLPAQAPRNDSTAAVHSGVTEGHFESTTTQSEFTSSSTTTTTSSSSSSTSSTVDGNEASETIFDSEFSNEQLLASLDAASLDWDPSFMDLEIDTAIMQEFEAGGFTDHSTLDDALFSSLNIDKPT